MQGIGTETSLRAETYHFHAGTDTRAYETFGVHRESDGRYRFRIYAPSACRVAVCGDMTEEPVPMYAAGEGIWEGVILSDIPLEGMCYWFLMNGQEVRADPYARRGFYGDRRGSVICIDSAHQWQDDVWMAHRRKMGQHDRPYLFYEVHLGSFATRSGRSNTGEDAYLNYRELGVMLARYAADMGFTHIKLLPLAEHRSAASHGYEMSDPFAPTSRHGTPDDLRAMIDHLHRHGLGVVMDLPLGGERMDLLRPETQSYWLSVVFFWLREFHLDGVCLLGLSRRQIFEDGWEEARDCFLSLLCAAVHTELPGVSMIAGESVGQMTGAGGAGFDLLCCGRSGEDVLTYLHTPPADRYHLRDLIVRSVCGARDERCLLTLSHREVCRGGSSLLLQMQGSYLQKFRGVRLAFAFHMLQHGGKLLFMGSELGQSRTWNADIPPDWFLAELETHAALMRYVRALHRFCREESCLWREGDAGGAPILLETESEAEGASALFALGRSDLHGRMLLALINASPEDVPCRCAAGEGAFVIAFHSDRTEFGGDGRVSEGETVSAVRGWLTVNVPAMTAIFFVRDKSRKSTNFP